MAVQAKSSRAILDKNKRAVNHHLIQELVSSSNQPARGSWRVSLTLHPCICLPARKKEKKKGTTVRRSPAPYLGDEYPARIILPRDAPRIWLEPVTGGCSSIPRSPAYSSYAIGREDRRDPRVCVLTSGVGPPLARWLGGTMVTLNHITPIIGSELAIRLESISQWDACTFVH